MNRTQVINNMIQYDVNKQIKIFIIKIFDESFF